MPSALPPATRAIIAVNVVAFLLQQYLGNAMVALFALWPLGSGLFHAWQLITYAFLHGSLAHIFFNMFALYMFGGELERLWGPRRLVGYFLVCALAAGVTQLAVQGTSTAAEATIGASGGVFGVLLAFAWYFPRRRLC